MAMTAQQEQKFINFCSAFKNYGYFVQAEAADGLEEVFLADLQTALDKIHETAEYLRKKYRYRGVSRRLLEELHVSLPEPSFNVIRDI